MTTLIALGLLAALLLMLGLGLVAALGLWGLAVLYAFAAAQPDMVFVSWLASAGLVVFMLHLGLQLKPEKKKDDKKKDDKKKGKK